MSVKIGFTGTREGMTQAQKKELRLFLSWVRTVFDPPWEIRRPLPEFDHGDCDGSDEQAQAIALELGFYVRCHPPTNPKYRAFTKGNHQTMPPLPYGKRNGNIAANDVLVAAPKSYRRTGGTWDTVKRARALGKPVFILDPGKP